MRRLVFILMTAVAATVRSQTPATSELRLVVNLPAYRLDAYLGDSLVRTIPVAVGKPGFETPRGEFAITSIEWNPWWIPPDRPWARKEKKTPPGPTNPMGRVKLNFRPLYFLHGSPFEASMGSAASHGCVRLRNTDAIELARLVHRYGTPRLSADDIDRLATDTATRIIVLDVPVPLDLRYDRVEIRAGRVLVHRDIYGVAPRSLADQVVERLMAQGIDSATVDTVRVRALTKGVGRSGKSTLLDSLLLVHERR